MCDFFSFISDGTGKAYYFDWEMRQKEMKEKKFEPDSHASIASYFRLNEDKTNKYEFNPLTKQFKADLINIEDDQAAAERWVEKLDFKKVVEPLIVKKIVHPFKVKAKELSPHDKHLLKQWSSVRDSVWDSVRASVGDSVGASVRASVWDSVRASVGASVRDSVRASVGDSVGDSVRASVGDSVRASVGASVRDSVRASVRDSVRASVRASVWDSVRASVWDSVRDSVWDSVRDSVWAYTSSFFDIKYKNDYSPLIKLWKRGFVPSFDGTIWRLHAGLKAKIVWEGNP